MGLFLAFLWCASVAGWSSGPRIVLRAEAGWGKFAMDSALEGDGFELPVPREMTTIFEPSAGVRLIPGSASRRFNPRSQERSRR